MNKLVRILVLGIILISVSFCCSTKNSSKEITKMDHPFKVVEAKSKTWVGGQPGVRGKKISISINNSEIQLDSVYFRNKKSDLKRELNASPAKFVGVFTDTNTKTDYILHKNAGREYGNKPPKANSKIPFELKETEAVISYSFEGKVYYYKVENVLEVKSDEKY
jgi:hypothetical protein